VEKMSNELFLVFRKCKCGLEVGCMLGDRIKNGDLIKHDNCKLSTNKNANNKTEVK